ncbi:cytochrome P450 [Streptomyces sp. NPDC019531]|uniref:cytochrome P450 n=1 Tax=Streptomyces sp. NPDC019531 TaxID=3365062 RepID=UPI00384D5971
MKDQTSTTDASAVEPLFRPYTAKADFPWEELKHDRERCPVVHSAELDAVQISSYAGVKELLGPEFHNFTGNYSTLWPLKEPFPVDEQIFASADPPRHTRQRKLFVKAMSASRIQNMRPFSERLANSLVDAIIERGTTFDLVTDYARRISEGHITELLGVPAEDRERFLHLSTLYELSTADPDSKAYMAESDEWREHLAALVRARRAAGPDSDDLITALCFAEVDGDRYDELEIAGLIRSVIRAGNTTTAAAIINSIHLLERHPEQKARYLADIDGLSKSLLDEGLRYDSPVMGLWRVCARPTSIQGYELKPGDRVFTLNGSANHDPEAFDRPDEFIVDRDWSTLPPHLAFGHGIHHCIGMNLARLECEVGFATLYRRLPGLRMRPDAVTPQTPGPVFRSWQSLEMEYDLPEGTES